MNWGIYLLPSIITLANMCAGLYSIFCSVNEKFIWASWAIILAIIFDILDGFIARLTKGTSLLGAELDSFADFVSFCIAPAILVYFVVLKQYKTPGLIVCAIYVFLGAIRLARFNLKALESKTSVYTYFEGLPVPAAGGILASFVLTFELFQRFEQGITAKAIPLLMQRIPFMFKTLPAMMIILSFLMVTKLHYTRFKRLRVSQKIPMRTFLIVVITLLLIFAYPENMIFIIFLGYIVSGIVGHIWRVYIMRTKK